MTAAMTTRRYSSVEVFEKVARREWTPEEGAAYLLPPPPRWLGWLIVTLQVVLTAIGLVAIFRTSP